MTRPGRASLLVALLVVVAIACFGEAWRTTHQPRRLAPVAHSRVMSPHAVAREATSPGVPSGGQATDDTAAGADAVAPPVRVDVPAVGMSASVQPIGLAADGSVDVPPPTVAGWYTGGPAPGGVGPAVLVGHVDSQTGPAVFYRLNGVYVGDQVTVTRADGSLARFIVSAVTQVNKSAFPTAAVFAPTDGPTLRLITCTGAFDTTQRHYVDSLIAWATPAPEGPGATQASSTSAATSSSR